MLALLIGCIPIFSYGLFPTIATMIGGKPNQQIYGASLGALLVAVIVTFTFHIPLPSTTILLIGTISGIGWAFGQTMGFIGYKMVGSSRALPLHTGIQLVVNCLWGVIALGNWPTLRDKLLGFSALIIITIGTYLTIWSKHPKKSSVKTMRIAILLQILGSLGYWLYSAAPRFINIPGPKVFLAQTIGMVLGSSLYCLFTIKVDNAFTAKVSYQQIATGILFGFGILAYFIVAQPNMLGLATAYVMSQVCVVVATLTGIFWLHQRKTQTEFIVTMLGLVLILGAAVLTVLIQK
ncbi:GRP family sugar transporter [Fructilactobacillus frigidiflavus]|uniref:GRP family sugar transporter n=1 Tax=Fructilactobacillus frigidiflavus TaxID=3242688 RepID=UPI003756DBF0